MRELSGTTQEFFRKDDDRWESKTEELENAKVVESLYRAIERSDVAAFKNTLDESVQLDIVGPNEIPFSGSASGREAVVEFAIQNFSQLQEQNAQIVEVVAQGNFVVVFGQETGKFKQSGSGPSDPYEIEWIQRFKISNGHVMSIKQIFVASMKAD
ncbi:MAG: nuclear transport factor 2 family protein [Planctomycetota bacterium]